MTLYLYSEITFATHGHVLLTVTIDDVMVQSVLHESSPKSNSQVITRDSDHLEVGTLNYN